MITKILDELGAANALEDSHNTHSTVLCQQKEPLKLYCLVSYEKGSLSPYIYLFIYMNDVVKEELLISCPPFLHYPTCSYRCSKHSLAFFYLLCRVPSGSSVRPREIHSALFTSTWWDPPSFHTAFLQIYLCEFSDKQHPHIQVSPHILWTPVRQRHLQFPFLVNPRWYMISSYMSPQRKCILFETRQSLPRMTVWF